METENSFYIKKIKLPKVIVRFAKKLPEPIKGKIRSTLSNIENYGLTLQFTPRISIIVPVYNNSLYLKECIDSAIKQNYKNFELIVVDDKSTDNKTLEILKQYENHGNVKIFYNSINLGISKTQNRAITYSSGPYVAFLDCDDLLEKDALKVVAKYIRINKKAAYFYSNRTNIDSKNKEIEVEDFKNRNQRKPLEELKKGMFTSHLKVIRRDVFKKVGFHQSEYDGAQDYDMALKAAEFFKFCHIPHALYRHRIHDQQNTQTSNKKQKEKADKILQKAIFREKIRMGKVGKTTIVILSFNRADSLRSCLKAIRENTKIPYEVLIFDNASSAETVEYLKEIEKGVNIKVVYNKENLGCPGGRAKAVKMASGKYVVTIDNDVEVTENWLEDMIIRIEEDKNIAGACARLMLPNGHLEYNGGTFLSDGKFINFELHDRGKGINDLSTMIRIECDWIPGGATIFKKKVVDKVCHDSKYINSFEDNDYSMQVKELGYRLVNCPEAVMIHNHSNFQKKNDKSYLKMRVNRFDGRSLYSSILTFYKKWGLIIKDPSVYEKIGIGELREQEIIKGFDGKEKNI